jgi:hypothetical protein
MYLHMYVYTLRARRQECVFHMRMRPQKRAWWQRRLSTNRPTAKRILHYRTVRKPIATDYVWEGMWLEDKQGVRNPHVDKLQGCNATRNYIFPEPQARM